MVCVSVDAGWPRLLQVTVGHVGLSCRRPVQVDQGHISQNKVGLGHCWFRLKVLRNKARIENNPKFGQLSLLGQEENSNF